MSVLTYVVIKIHQKDGLRPLGVLLSMSMIVYNTRVWNRVNSFKIKKRFLPLFCILCSRPDYIYDDLCGKLAKYAHMGQLILMGDQKDPDFV